MMVRSLRAALLAATLALRLAAQETTPPKSMKLTLDFGFVSTSGNSQVTTLSFGEAFSYKGTSPWGARQSLTVVQGKSDGVQTADQVKTQAQLLYDFSPRFGAYLLGGYEHNRFAGIDFRYEEGGGLSLKVIDASRDKLLLEGGVSFNQQHSTAPVVSSDFAASRVAGGFKHLFTEATYFLQVVEWLANLQDGKDQRLNSETSVVAPISSHIAIKMSYVIRYDHQPIPGFKTTDRTFTSGIQIVF